MRISRFIFLLLALACLPMVSGAEITVHKGRDSYLRPMTITPSASSIEAPNLKRASGRKKLATAFRLVREPSIAQVDDPTGMAIRHPQDVFQLMEPFARVEQQEVFWVIPLNSQHRTKGPVVVTRGTLNVSLVHPREVFLRAICANSAAVILCHNHPSGDPTPSPDDHVTTEQLVAAGKLLDIPVQDHVIIGWGRYISFALQGQL